MNKYIVTLAAAAMTFCGAVSSYAAIERGFDISKFAYKSRHHANVFDSERMQQIEAANAILEAGKPSRFATPLSDNAAKADAPDLEFRNSELHGDMDGPDGRLWFYSGSIAYEKVVHNEYFTEYLPQSFEVTIYNPEMKSMGTIKSTLKLKEDEARVRQVSVLPLITKNYFNTDDKFEVCISVLVNPLPYGIRPYTYIYSLGNEKDADGNDVPVMELNRLISDVCDASDEKGENIIMSFVYEGNDSDVSESDLMSDSDKFWEYQLGNFIKMESYAKADASGELKKVFDKRIIYYQTQGNQQDDASMMTFVRNGKPMIVAPHYEKVFYEKFDMMSDMVQQLPNNLVVELYELNDENKGFELKQKTLIPMKKADNDGVIASYYGIGAFGWTDDVIFGEDDKASFIVTRRDYVASSDSEVLSYFIYDSEGKLVRPLFENTSSHARMSDLPGFDPMEIFITVDAQGYWFNFLNLKTFETELSINYGLTVEDSDEPDYMMANIDRVKVGDSFMYVAEMRMPEYDDINDVNYMRVVWLTRDGKVERMDRVNMGNLVNYATLYINSATLDPDYFHKGPEQEYMLLIKRAFEESSSKTEEQLLIGQATSEEYPQGRDLLLLGHDDELGDLVTIIPYTEPNRLSVTYGKIDGSLRNYSTIYYDLPLNKDEAGIADIAVEGSTFTFDGANIALEGAYIEVYNMQGIRVAAGNNSVNLGDKAAGVYLVRAAGHTGKIVLK